MRTFRTNPSSRPGVVWLAWACALGLGALQAWRGRFDVVDDCVSYLDVGDAYLRGDFHAALNGYWSPAYSWLLGLAVSVLRPSPRWEFPAVHVVNFLIFAAGLWAFDDFAGALNSWSDERAEGSALLGPAAMRVLGAALFSWCALGLVSMAWTGADILLMLVVTVAFRLLVEVRRRPADRGTWALFGAVLGLCYLSKTVMLPVGLVFLLSAMVGRPSEIRWRGLLAALASFALAIAVFIVPLSRSRGRPTFGEAGRLNFAWHVNHVAKAYWQGGPEGNGTPVHSYRLLVSSPPTWAFGVVFGEATYAPWYDPSYWYEGVRLRLAPREVLARVRAVGPRLRGVALGLHGGVLGIVLVALLLGKRGRWGRVVRLSPLLLPGLAILGFYTAIRFEARYLAPFLAPALLALVCAARSSGAPERRGVMTGLVLVVWAALTVHVAGVFRPAPSATDRFGDIAESLRRLGVRPGDRAAVLEFGSDDHSPWARLARVRIVAEVASSDEHPNERAFWTAPAEARGQVLDAFRREGLRLVVSREAPVEEPGWKSLGRTGYSVLFLSE